MEYALLGTSGLRVSKVCLGTFPFGIAPLARDADALVGRALELGINFIDTANSYGNQSRFDRPGVAPPAAERDSSEALVGRAVRGRRHEVVLATKVQEWMYDGPNGGGPEGGGLTRKHMREQVEQSLRRMGTDYIDLYHAHHPDPTTPLTVTLRTFDELVREGKVRYYALSTYPAHLVTEALWVCDRMGLTRPVAHQVRYSLVAREPERDVLPLCHRHGIGVTAFSPLGGGVLVGSDRLNRPHPGRRRFTTEGEVFDGGALAVAQRVEGLAAEWGLSAVDVALGWVLSKPGVVSAIAGPETIAELEADVPAATLRLSAEQLTALDDVSA